MAKLQYHPLGHRLTKEEIDALLNGDYEDHSEHGTLTYADMCVSIRQRGSILILTIQAELTSWWRILKPVCWIWKIKNKIKEQYQ